MTLEEFENLKEGEFIIKLSNDDPEFQVGDIWQVTGEFDSCGLLPVINVELYSLMSRYPICGFASKKFHDGWGRILVKRNPNDDQI